MRKLVNTVEFLSSPLAKKLYPFIKPIADRMMGFHKLNIHYDTIIAGCKKDNTAFSAQALINFQATFEVEEKLNCLFLIMIYDTS